MHSGGAPALLVVFGGLPGTGKTTVSREVAMRRRATWLRIDAIEQAIRAADVLAGPVGVAGYAVAQALAAANLSGGRVVVVDAVNPVEASRAAWRDIAHAASCPLLDIEMVCTDVRAHRHRVETRRADVPGLVPPTWAAVMAHGYELRCDPRLVIDTATLGRDEAVRTVCDAIDRMAPA